jgi:DNA primase
MEKFKILKDILGKPFVSNEEHLYYCPYCRHHKRKMSVNIERDVYKCWICDVHGRKVRRVIKRFGSYAQLKDWDLLSGKEDITEFDKLFDDIVKENAKNYLTLPQEFVTLTGRNKELSSMRVLNYLKNRNVTQEDIIKWKIGYCIRGQFEGRVIIPSFDMEGHVNYFIARSFTDDWRKYLNPSASRDIVFNHLFVDWDKDVVLVEGVFDAIVAGCNSIPMLGSTLRVNSLLFQEIIKNDASVFIALDEDAKKKSINIIHKLLSYGAEVYKIDTSGYEDIGEMSKEEFALRKKNATFMNPDTFMIDHALDSIKV